MINLVLQHLCADASHAFIHLFIYSFITRFPIRRSGALQQTFYGSPPACPVLGFDAMHVLLRLSP